MLYNCIHPTWIQLIYQTPLPSFTVRGISFAVVYSSVLEIWHVNLLGANFWARDFSGSPGYFFCVSIFLPLDYPCHFKSSIPLLRAPTAVILILRGKKLNQFYLHRQLSYKCILILVY